MTLHDRATLIADAADRGGVWWDDIYAVALRHLEEAHADGIAIGRTTTGDQ